MSDAVPAGGSIELVEEPMSALAEHARIPIAFEVDRVVDVAETPRGFALTERALAVPYRKDYDAIEGNGPREWPKQFDLSNWGLIAAMVGGKRVGGVVLAFDTPDVRMLEGRRDLAVVWDIRVAPEHRRAGVGSALFRAAGTWAEARGCRQLKVETQNINVPACRFYAREGCVLKAVNRFAYPDLPDEVQLLWYRERSASR